MKLLEENQEGGNADGKHHLDQDKCGVAIGERSSAGYYLGIIIISVPSAVEWTYLGFGNSVMVWPMMDGADI